MLIREETAQDLPGIRALDYATDIVDKLRSDRLHIVSLVAVNGDEVIGHILFSQLPVEIDGRAIRAASLAPVVVKADLRGKGIGSKLVTQGLDILRQKQLEAVIVLGHTWFYPRFGFSADLTRHLASPFRGNPSFMGLELRPGALAGEKGSVTYPAAFGRGDSK